MVGSTPAPPSIPSVMAADSNINRKNKNNVFLDWFWNSWYYWTVNQQRLAVWMVSPRVCLWELNFRFVFGFNEVLPGNMLAYTAHCCLCFVLLCGETLACNLLFSCLPFIKSFCFHVFSEEKFPGATEHLKRPVFPDRVLQNKILKTHAEPNA